MHQDSIQDEGSQFIRFDALPPDMQVLLDDFIRGCGRDVPIPALFPLVEVVVKNIPIIALDPFDRGPDYAFQMNLDDTPPIIVADGHFMDGKHRAHAARASGRSSLPAIDLTGLIDPRMLELNSMGRLSMIEPDLESMAASIGPR